MDAERDPDGPTPRAPPEDLATVARLRARDRAEFEALVDRLHGPLLRMALNYVSSHAVAEEVVQETWLGVLGGLATFEGRSTLKTWIFRILVNRAKTRGVREARSVPFSATERDGERDPAVAPERFRPNEAWASPPPWWDDETPEKLLRDRETTASVLGAIAALPERQRLVLTLRDVEGFDAEEVRNILGLTETNQRVLLHRARSKVRAELERILAGG